MKRRNEYLVEVGNRIRKVRKMRGISLESFAPMIPMHPDAYRRIEHGYVSCLLITLKGIADALDVDIKVFL